MLRLIAFFRSEIDEFRQFWTQYNPERHYMRGPGPKWREKHAGVRIAGRQGEPPLRVDGAGRIITAR